MKQSKLLLISNDDISATQGIKRENTPFRKTQRIKMELFFVFLFLCPLAQKQ